MSQYRKTQTHYVTTEEVAKQGFTTSGVTANDVRTIVITRQGLTT